MKVYVTYYDFGSPTINPSISKPQNVFINELEAYLWCLNSYNKGTTGFYKEFEIPVEENNNPSTNSNTFFFNRNDSDFVISKQTLREYMRNRNRYDIVYDLDKFNILYITVNGRSGDVYFVFGDDKHNIYSYTIENFHKVLTS